MTNFKRFVVMLNNIEGVETSKEMIKEHVRFLQKLESENKLDMCGPFSDYPGGMLVLNVDTLDEAKEIAESDPFVQSKIKELEIRTLELSCNENNHHGFGG